MINRYWFFIVLVTTMVSYYYFFITGFIYYFSDVFAYLSFADSLYQYGNIYEITTLPKAAPITPQNGIVLIFTALRFFTEDMMLMIQIVIVLLTINLFFIFYIVYKIGEILDIEKNILKIFTLSLVFSFYFYSYYVTPTNDGLYVSLFLLSIYLILKLIQEDDNSFNRYWIYLFFIAILIPLFRLQGMVELIASIIVFTLLQKNYKKAFFSFLLLISAFISVRIIIYFLIDDFSGFERLSKNLLFYNFETFPNSIKMLLSDVVPSMYLNFQADYLNTDFFVIFKILASCIVLLYTIFVFFKSFIAKNSKIFFLILIIFGNYGVLILFNVMVDRYIYINAVILSLIILYYLKKPYRNYFAILLLSFSILTFGIRLVYKDFPKNEMLTNIEYINKNFDKYNLISQSPRHFYFYLNKPTITNFEYIDKNLPILLIGDEKYISKNIDNFNKQGIPININKLPIVWSPMRDTKYGTYKINILEKEGNNE